MVSIQGEIRANASHHLSIISTCGFWEGKSVHPSARVRVCVCAGMEGDGEVIIGPVLNCSHCKSGECYDVKDSVVCDCDDDLILAPDGVSCINVTGQ